MAKHRQGRLSEEIKKSISSFLINGAKDPRLTSRIISITGVDVTRDGSYATVYVSPVCLSNEDKDAVYAEVLEGFNKAKGALRSQVSRDIKLRWSSYSSWTHPWTTEDISIRFLRHLIFLLRNNTEINERHY